MSGTFTAISSVYTRSCGIRTSRDLECWGYSGLVNDAPTGTFTKLFSGVYHAYGTTTAGEENAGETTIEPTARQAV